MTTKKYYKVVGSLNNYDYLLGYTSSPSAWKRNANGWKAEQLLFIPMN